MMAVNIPTLQISYVHESENDKDVYRDKFLAFVLRTYFKGVGDQ